MSDIVQRLRDSATQARAIDRSALLAEAADEIVKIRRDVEELRGGLTDAEREAVDAAQNHIDGYDGEWGDEIAATLRGLLERKR